MSEAIETFERHMPGWQKALILVLVAVSFVVGYMAIFWHPVKEQALPEPRASRPDYLPSAPRWVDPPLPKPEAAPVVNPLPQPTGGLPSILPQTRTVDPAQLSRESSILGPAGSQPPPKEAASQVERVKADSDDTALGGALKVTKLEGSRATRLKNPEMTIVEGSRIPCTIENAFTTEQPGYLSCIVPVDVRGYGGHVVLLPAGTKITGQYQSGIRQGQSRAFIVWTKAITPMPDAVMIDLNSPAADQLGRAGLDGNLNTHFWARFGGAIMLSMIDSGLSAAAQLAASQSGGTNYFQSFSFNGQSVANTALQNSINIPPTLEFDQAKTQVVFLARNLDFSNVYSLQKVR